MIAYDVSSDGQRFLMVQKAASTDSAAPVPIIVVQNWLEELKRLVPVESPDPSVTGAHRVVYKDA